MIDDAKEVVKGGVKFTVLKGGLLSKEDVRRKLSGDPKPDHPSRVTRTDTVKNTTDITGKKGE